MNVVTRKTVQSEATLRKPGQKEKKTISKISEFSYAYKGRAE